MTTVLLALAHPATAPTCAGRTLADVTALYAESVRTGDYPTIERIFGRDGRLSVFNSSPYRGGRAIARYLSGFPGWRLLESSYVIQWVEPAGRDWQVRGAFRDRGTSPDGTAFTTDGQFRAVWRCERDGWRLRRMATGVPDPVLS